MDVKEKVVTTNDNRPANQGRDLLSDLIMALRFYSLLPTGTRSHEAPTLSRMAPALPFASLVIMLAPGLTLAIAYIAGTGSLFAATIAIAVSVLVTGAMAEDALADATDGLFGGKSPQRRLEIMKETAHGTFGTLALVIFVVLRIAAIAALLGHGVFMALCLLTGATILARSGALLLPVLLPPARPDGVSASVGRPTRTAFGFGALFAILITLALSIPTAGPVAGLTASVIIAPIAFASANLCRRKVGGQTGDLIGALQAVLEIAALAVFIAFVGH